MADVAALATTEETRRAWLQAADAGAIDQLQALLTSHPSLLNCCDRHQSLKACTALHVCAWRNHAKAAEFLLQRGANIEARDEAGMTPLQIDILRVCMEKMRPIPLLRARCIDVSSPVALAKYKRQLVRDRANYHEISTTTLEVLLKYKADVNSYTHIGDAALLLAMDDGLTKHVTLLLSHGADAFCKDTHGRMALDIAAEHGYADLVGLLVKEYPALVQLAGERALLAAIHHDTAPVVGQLFDAVMALPRDDPLASRVHSGELLHTAVEYDARDATALLLDRGVPVNHANEDGETALHIASRTFDCGPLFGVLLDRHADGNKYTGKNGFSPYHTAVQHHSIHAIEALAKHKADINLLDRNMHTPLVFAALHGYNIDIMDTLIENGAHFRFCGGTASLDAVAPLLVAWVYNVSPKDIPCLVDQLLVSGCADQERLRAVVTCLLWSKHFQEALLVLFLVVFTATTKTRQIAFTVVSKWLESHHQRTTATTTTTAVQKLLHDVLQQK